MRRGRGIGAAVSAVAVAVIVFTFDWRSVGAHLREFDWRYLAPALAVYLLGFAVRAFRWQVMLAPLKRVPFRSSFIVVMIGFMANNILPLRMGEVVRAWAIKRREGISGSAGFATIVVERVYDGLTLIGLFLFVLIFSATTPEIRRYAALGAPVFLAALGLLLYAAFRPARAAAALKAVSRILPGRFHALSARLIDSFLPGLAFLSSAGRQAAVIASSLAVWLLEGCVFWIIMRGFGMGLPPHAAFFTLVVVNIAIMVPAMPGYVGTFDLPAVAALAPFGVGKDAAMGYIIVVHALQYVSVTGLGLAFMSASGWSLREIEQADRG
ncbi:MAG: lysylphosphatidylglycerol synthase transmembrane domain-containing protein [bacterium]|nr:lysylphosphatidylglycerol synthase transmembrane domain-containing protein [bacterium]